jgi:hypothetical protein
MGFDPYNCTLKIWESIWESNSHNGSSLRSVKVHSLTLFTLFVVPGACDVITGPPSWPTTLQAFALVMNPRLGLRQEDNQQITWKTQKPFFIQGE